MKNLLKKICTYCTPFGCSGTKEDHTETNLDKKSSA